MKRALIREETFPTKALDTQKKKSVVMNVFCAFKGSYPEGQAMANRLALYAKVLDDPTIDFRVASEGGKSKENKRILRPGHEVWYWRKPALLDKIPIMRDLYASAVRWKLYFHVFGNRNIDVVFSIGYHWIQLGILVMVCKLSGKKLIVELNEIPHSIIARRMQSVRANELKRWLTFHLIYPMLDGFVVISENLLQMARKYGSKNCRILKIPILTDEVAPKNQYDPKEEAMIFHAGTLTVEKDGILTVFEAIGLAMQKFEKNIRFVLSNYRTLPTIKKQIESIVDKYEMRDKVVFYDFMKKADLENAFRCSALAIINKPDNFRNRYNFSTKLGECMSYALPIISTNVGESKQYLKDGDNCLVIHSSKDAQELCQHILRILENPDLARHLGTEARKTANNYFLYSNYKQPFKDFLNRL